MLDSLFSRPRLVFAAIAALCAGMLAFGILYLQNVVNKARYVIPVAIQESVIKAGHPVKHSALSGQVEADTNAPKKKLFDKIFGKK